MNEGKSAKTELNRIPDEKGRMIFPPGVSGNPNGRPAGAVSVVDAIKRKLNEIYPEADNETKRTYLDVLIENIFSKAIEDKDVSMIKDMIDRVDGKPKQPLTGDEDQPITIKLISYSEGTDGDNDTQQL